VGLAAGNLGVSATGGTNLGLDMFHDLKRDATLFAPGLPADGAVGADAGQGVSEFAGIGGHGWRMPQLPADGKPRVWLRRCQSAVSWAALMRTALKYFGLWLAAWLPLACSSAEPLAEVKKAVAEKRAVLVDVREQGEWDAGHLRDAQLLPLSRLQENPRAGANLPKDRPVYLYCRSGRRSQIAAKILQEQGYDARSLSAGYKELVREGFVAAGR